MIWDEWLEQLVGLSPEAEEWRDVDDFIARLRSLAGEKRGTSAVVPATFSESGLGKKVPDAAPPCGDSAAEQVEALPERGSEGNLAGYRNIYTTAALD